MDPIFWQRLHGGSTHLPIVLLPLSVALDYFASRSREEAARRAFHAAGLATAVMGAVGGCGAVAAGLFMSRGQMLGSGVEKLHHLYVWPAFGLFLGLTTWRLFNGGQLRERSLRIYLAAMSVASALTMGAGYWGGELLLHAEVSRTLCSTSATTDAASVKRGHELFLMNCAHCHGDDAHGTEEAPDLTSFRKSDTRIASVVKNGIKGEMPRFDQKLTDSDVQMLICFIHSLNGGQLEMQTVGASGNADSH